MKNKAFKRFLIFLPLIAGVIIGGVVYFSKNDNSLEKNLQEETQPSQEENRRENQLFSDENLVEASAEDLVIGQSVFVIGDEDESGIITAKRILLGFSREDFETRQNQRFQGVQPPTQEPSGERLNIARLSLPEGMSFEKMRNLSSEERQKLMEQMRKSGNFPSMPQREQNNNAVVRGEIIDRDEKSIILKLEDGGSKIVFYLPETQVFKRKEIE